MINIDELLELEAKATPGPWSTSIGISGVVPRSEPNQAFDCSNDNAELISAMRNNIRPLLLELKAARECIAVCDKVNKSIQKVCEYVDVTMTAGGNSLSVDFVSEQKAALDTYFSKVKGLEGGET